MANIQKRDNGKWRARYRDDSGKEHARHFPRKLDAQRWLDEVSASQLKGEYVHPKDALITLEQYAAQWLKTVIVSPSRLRHIETELKLHILPALGKRRVSSLRKSDVQALIVSLGDKLQPGSIRNVHATLSVLLNAAMDDRLLLANPANRVRKPRATKARISIPPADKVSLLMEIHPALIGVMALGGLRVGEALGLKPSDIDYSERTINVERQRTTEGTVTLPKTKGSIRTVPIGDGLATILKEHAQSLPSGTEYLFLNNSGNPMLQPVWAKRMRELGEEHGFSFTSHDLRHFAASALIAGGATVKQVQVVLGHSSASITLNTYSHLWPGDDDRVRAVMDRTAEALTGSGRPLDGTETDAGPEWLHPPVWD